MTTYLQKMTRFICAPRVRIVGVGLFVLALVGAGSLSAAATSRVSDSAGGTPAREAIGAQALTTSATVGVPSCPNGQAPGLSMAAYPERSIGGGVTPEAAFRAANPNLPDFAVYRFGNHPSAPAWIVAGSATFVATILQDGTWVVSAASFIGCRGEPPRRSLPSGG